MANQNEEYHIVEAVGDEGSYTKDREPHLNDDNFSSAVKAGGVQVMTTQDEVGEQGVRYPTSRHSSQESDATLKSPEASVFQGFPFLSMASPDEGDDIHGNRLTEAAMHELERNERFRYSGNITQWIQGSLTSRPIVMGGQPFGYRGSMHANSHRSTSWHSQTATEASYVMVPDHRQQDEDVADAGALFHDDAACVPRSFDELSLVMEDM